MPLCEVGCKGFPRVRRESNLVKKLRAAIAGVVRLRKNICKTLARRLHELRASNRRWSIMIVSGRASDWNSTGNATGTDT